MMEGMDEELATQLIESILDKEGLAGDEREARRAELSAAPWFTKEVVPMMAELIATGSIVIPQGRVDVDPFTGRRSWHPNDPLNDTWWHPKTPPSTPEP